MRIALIVLIVLSLPSLALGGDNIIVRDVLDLPGLPPETRTMTPAEFFDWAVAENAKAEAACQQRALAYRESKQDTAFTRVAHVTDTSGGSITKTGGGYGAGGVGGAGGYLGYPTNSQTGLSAGSFGGVYGNYRGGHGRGSGTRGNVTTSGYNQETVDRYVMYPDLNDGGGGPLWIINPYCPPALQNPPYLPRDL